MTTADLYDPAQLRLRKDLEAFNASEPNRLRWFFLYVPDRRDRAALIADVIGVARHPQRRGRMAFFAKPADLLELLDTFVDECIEFR